LEPIDDRYATFINNNLLKNKTTKLSSTKWPNQSVRVHHTAKMHGCFDLSWLPKYRTRTILVDRWLNHSVRGWATPDQTWFA
jgi:hypothetical protein